VTDDEIRSLAISQRLLGTTEIVLIHHTDCGMLMFKDNDFRRQIEQETGCAPSGPLGPSRTSTRTCARTSPE
jgi:carbonic anhydrase